MKINIEDHIPQRAPFLFIDDVQSQGENFVITSKKLTGDEDFFKGHFPGNPVMPGVLMCEAVFQTGALLMSLKGMSANANNTAVVTRIQNAKFKNMVKPLDHLHIKVELTEMLGPAAFMKGKITRGDETIMTLDFACSLVDKI
jgi:3-hydroxyacyl-[acyl-carrier-protein] dehydratase